MLENSHFNFLITGHGRSGTKFLSSIMNLSNEWTVLHEPDPKGIDAPFDLVQQRFNRMKYGEVNSYLRSMLFDLKVDKKGVILRNPSDIWISIANRCENQQWPEKLRRLYDSVEIISKAVSLGIYKIYFDQMTKSISYLQSVLFEFGIKDVKIKKENLLPINETSYFKYQSLDDFPKSITDKLNIICEKWEKECI